MAFTLPDQKSQIVNGAKPIITNVSELVDGKLYWVIVKKSGQAIERSLGLVYKAVVTEYISGGYVLVSAQDTFYAPNDITSIMTAGQYQATIDELKETIKDLESQIV